MVTESNADHQIDYNNVFSGQGRPLRTWCDLQKSEKPTITMS